MLRPRLRVPRVSASIGLQAAANARRSFHQVPRLRHDYTESGVPNLMSPAGFSIAWSDYMSLAIEKLNALTVGTELEDLDTKTIALMTAREPNQAPIFNWASMAHNNHFFFDGLTPDPTPIPEVLKRELEASFSSMETLRREFVITASSMFGPGFIWLGGAGGKVAFAEAWWDLIDWELVAKKSGVLRPDFKSGAE
ncbi:unnamed protein product [Clonostachys rosea f. rosea IK726]|uniref:Manganese/iron superoxide dismutase C-terminal domain-containing protein n=2 Tax=Bionectria ochroleuca TaxID=29856 RepID=A0A0B7JPU2_BIOOC|nr:unnamed protein product [Clonostachys rosea f. rosea IK726]